jgi:hypothetical protein
MKKHWISMMAIRGNAILGCLVVVKIRVSAVARYRTTPCRGRGKRRKKSRMRSIVGQRRSFVFAPYFSCLPQA